ncbi:transcriptional regulator, DeoR family [Paenibacillus sp. UNCCL117]|uniref:DeoR/GlpR family DNA-binding transcription regulator n=1 Tax=unclassified Paenibacillus TaxID=185978 RepID=UPI00087FE351|nr:MULTISPECIES: DeoR/GlpR family DNA-binding transcription regulator [unclassified Paenibacillus]SDC18646.1 transcriptional regulator, DeoR family [Paenibacillus sp. cl123]SFW18247.1 transcriptional regulator, DeoR family [Paenibacillus sp. UNCCL117]
MVDRAPSKGDRRREQIMNLLKRQGRVTIQEMIEKFDCSEATARRDLDVLERQGGIIRSLGGAQLESPAASGREISFFEKKQLLWLEKEAIAAQAAKLVEEGDVVGLTGGTTTFLIARELKLRRGITVVTNAVNIAMELSESDGVQVVLTGGVMRRNSFELCGPLAERIIEGINIGIMFMGIDGIAEEQGLTTFSEQEADIARLMLKRSLRSYAVFDHTKAGRTSLFSMAPLTTLTGCITNKIPDEPLRAFLEANGIALHLAETGLDS